MHALGLKKQGLSLKLYHYCCWFLSIHAWIHVGQFYRNVKDGNLTTMLSPFFTILHSFKWYLTGTRKTIEKKIRLMFYMLFYIFITLPVIIIHVHAWIICPSVSPSECPPSRPPAHFTLVVGCVSCPLYIHTFFKGFCWNLDSMNRLLRRCTKGTCQPF